MTARTDVGTVDELHASATKAVGLDDFGTDDDNYREALGVLLESYRRDADLTELGSKMSRFFVRNALVARLLSEAAWKQYPQHVDVTIERPIFVTGLPRTGTTAMHRLLSADPGHQGLQLWLAEFPQPRPPRETWADNPVFQQLDAQFTKAHDENPGLHGPALHDRRRGGGVLAAAAAVAAFGVLRDAGAHAHLLAVAGQAGLDEAVSAAPQEPSADRPERRREAVGAEEPEPPVRPRRAVRDVSRRARRAVPPAGRDDHGVDVLAVAAHHRRAGRTHSSARQIGQDALETWSRGLELFNAVRAKHDPAQFCDVDYFDFIADPVQAVEGIYRRFGIELTDAARAAMEQMHAESQQGPRAPKHKYSLADYGLTAETVKERFQGL